MFLVQDAPLQALRHLFPDSLILGALTLIDNDYGVLCALFFMKHL